DMVPDSAVVRDVSLDIAVICEVLAPVPVKRKSPTVKKLVNDVPVPVTVVPLRAMVPAPAVAVLEEAVTIAELMTRNLPIVSRGTEVTVGAACVEPSNTKTSSTAGVVRAGVQLPAAVQAPDATFQV